MLSRFSHGQLCATLWTPACQASLSMGILQTRKLEWVVMHSSRVSSQSRDQLRISYISALTAWFFTTTATWEAQYTLWGWEKGFKMCVLSDHESK